MISSCKAVFFDAGGTLLYPYPSVGHIYSETAARYGRIVEAKKIEMLFREAWLRCDGLAHLTSHSSEKIEREWWRKLVLEIFNSVGGVENFEDFFHELYEIFGSPQAWKLYPEVLEVLKELKSRGVLIGMISNWDSRLLKLCDSLELHGYFDFILISAVFGASKPSVRIFQEALQRAGVKPDEAVHIGDSYEDDIHGASKAGIRGILVNRHEDERRIENVVVIRSLKELL